MTLKVGVGLQVGQWLNSQGLGERRLGSRVHRWAVVFVLALAFVVAADVALPGQAARADDNSVVDVSLDYAIYASGLRVAQGVVDLTIDPQAYAIALNAQPRGIISWITRWRFDANSTGILDGISARPLAYETARSRRNRDRKFRIAYDDRGPIQEIHDPPKVLREPVPVDNKQGTLDPLSATVALIKGASMSGNCPADLPVYDGRRRFDVKFVEAEIVELSGSQFSAFAGQAIRCRLQFEPIAGDFDSEDRSSFWYEDALAERRIDMWLAPVLGEGIPPIPVKLQGLGRYGPFYIHLSGVTMDTASNSDEFQEESNTDG